jgi:hypothetical protein
MRLLALLFCANLVLPLAVAKTTIAPVPDAIRSDRFIVTIDGKPASFAHAAANYYFLNFDLAGKAAITITAPTDDYWSKGVEVQPWRENIRPALKGRTISFTLYHPAKLSITRPGDHLAGAEMLFLFANPPETDAPAPDAKGIRYYGPGVYRESIDTHSGDSIYLAPGAVIFGSLNLWQVEKVKIWGRGVIIYNGAQDPDDDTGWKQLQNWHAIVMNNAHDISISGVTCIVRSRTWMIQMTDSRGITFDNVKVIGGSEANANQDGMDWLGGGDTVVRNSFIRAADDVFAMQSNWEGYDKLALPGHPVSNITVENSVLSTSISNIVRAGWPGKDFNGTNFVMRDSDVIHAGIGACGIPFALLEFWEDANSSGSSSGFHFENIRMEDWYSLVQLRQPNPALHDVIFKNIWSPEAPSLEPSTLLGAVSGVTFDHVRIIDRVAAGDPEIPLQLQSGAAEPSYNTSGPHALFGYTSGTIRPRQRVDFDASATTGARIRSYRWFFGDGSTASGRMVSHRFPDSEGTLWDRSGRFRVTLEVIDDQKHEDWVTRPVVVAEHFSAADTQAGTEPGLNYRSYDAVPDSFVDLSAQGPSRIGIARVISAGARSREQNYSIIFEGFLNVPAGGGYTFHMAARDEALLEIDGQKVAASPPPVPQVCGSPGNAVQLTQGSLGLRTGRHAIRISMSHTTGGNDFHIYWQGAGVPLEEIPATALSH